VDLQRIVCQPLPQGALLVFSHRLLHWGSIPVPMPVPVPVPLPTRPYAAGRGPRVRIAFSCAYADPSFEQPYLVAAHALRPRPPLGLRLALVSGQTIQYAHLSPGTYTCVRAKDVFVCFVPSSYNWF